LFPCWPKNKNIKELSFPKRVFLYFVKHRMWPMAKLISRVHSFLLN
jgi:hypothetical protein